MSGWRMRTPEQARSGLKIYFGVVIVLSAILEGWVITHGGLGGPYGLLVVPLMWTPTIACVVARLVGREGFGDISFRWGGATGTRASLAAWLLPVVVGLIAYGIAWNTGFADFKSAGDGSSRWLGEVFRALPRALTIGTVLSALTAFGEEVGWRGYMVPRLVEAKVPAPFLVSGLIWCAWHAPLILWGGYAVGAYPILSVALFFATILPIALLYAMWRMASGSVWPAVIAHAAWNVVIQGVFDRRSAGPGATLWVGESGIITALCVWTIYLIARNSRWAGTAPANGTTPQ